MDHVVARLHRCLAEAVHRARPDGAAGPVTVAEIYQELVPYRQVRGTLGVELNADYEHALLRLLAGDGGYARLEPPEAREFLRHELESPNPNVSLVREFAACEVWIEPAPVGDGSGEAASPPPETSAPAPAAAPLPPDASPPAPAGWRLEQSPGRIIDPEDVFPKMEGIAAGPAPAEAAAPAAPSEAAPPASGAATPPSSPEAAPPAPPEAPVPSPAAAPTRAPAPGAREGAAPGLPASPAPASPERAGEAAGARPAAPTRAPAPPLVARGQVAAVREAPAAARAEAPRAAGCRGCGEPLPAGRNVRFCPHCGHDQTSRPCPACGELLERGWRFCIACGARVAKETPTPA